MAYLMPAAILYHYGRGEARGVPLTSVELGTLLMYRGERNVLLKVIGFDQVSGIEESRLVDRALNQAKKASPHPLVPMSEPTKLVIRLKVVADLTEGRPKPFKGHLKPDSFLEEPMPEDLKFLAKGRLFMGYLRSGSKPLDVKVMVEPVKVFAKHVIISATTGRGKSNLLKVMLWSLLEGNDVGLLVMDAHREYYDVLSKHPNAVDNLMAFSPYPVSGERRLSISTTLLEPGDVMGSTHITEPQFRLMWKFREEEGERWVHEIFSDVEEALQPAEVVSLTALRAKLSKLLHIVNGECRGIFKLGVEDDEYSKSFLRQVKKALNEGKVVLIDTSTLSEEAELLIGNMIANDLLYERRRSMKRDFRPVAFAIEEAPRVLGREAPDNAYQRVAREGRKFNLGLIAVTQLLSVIPDEILANVNTKVYMGMASGKERRVAIDNAMHNLEGEEDEFTNLDVGEAILTSSELGMPIPLYIPEVHSLMRERAETAKQLKKVIEDD
jgi:hypothetical protein